MIDLSKIGFNIIERAGEPTEVTGGITLTAQVKISPVAPDQEGMKLHAQNRIREIIWNVCYGHLAEPMKHLRSVTADPVMSGCPSLLADEIIKAVNMLEDSINE